MAIHELSKRYEPKEVEKKWYDIWLSKGYFTADANDGVKPVYSLVIPPPNVTGALHMGHALNNTIQDALSRFKRMQGFNVLWLPGTDHAGIATQNVVEKELRKEGKTRHDLGREAFEKRVWEWKNKYGNTIIGQLKTMGCSCDWTRERFTMDEGLSNAVKTVFVTLYREGLIYRGNYIVNWCPRCQTALSDIEVEHKDTQGHFWYIKYPLKDEPGTCVTVATTRPETMLGDTAVAVNPADERWNKLIGKTLLLPIMNRKIKVIADESVDLEMGPGGPIRQRQRHLAGSGHQRPTQHRPQRPDPLPRRRAQPLRLPLRHQKPVRSRHGLLCLGVARAHRQLRGPARGGPRRHP